MILEYAWVDPEGRVDRLLELAGLQPPHDGHSIVHLVPALSCWPTPPFDGAVLVWRDGALAWADHRPVEEARAARWAEIKAHRAALDTAPIEVDGIRIDADERSRIDVMGAVVAMQLTGETFRAWRCSDNVMRVLTADQIQRAGIAIANRRQELIEISDGLARQIEAAASADEVRTVDWPAAV